MSEGKGQAEGGCERGCFVDTVKVPFPPATIITTVPKHQDHKCQPHPLLPGASVETKTQRPQGAVTQDLE